MDWKEKEEDYYSTPPPPPTTTSVQYRESRGELEEEEKQAPGCDC